MTVYIGTQMHKPIQHKREWGGGGGTGGRGAGRGGRRGEGGGGKDGERERKDVSVNHH